MPCPLLSSLLPLSVQLCVSCWVSLASPLLLCFVPELSLAGLSSDLIGLCSAVLVGLCLTALVGLSLAVLVGLSSAVLIGL